jgi:cytochrome c553
VEPLEEVGLRGRDGVPRRQRRRARRAVHDGLPGRREGLRRPVDVAVGPDGALYVSDDFTGAIYRVQYGAAAPLPGAASGASAARADRAAAADPLAAVSADERRQAMATGSELWESSGCAACHVEAKGAASQQTYRPLGGLAAKYSIDALATFLKTPQPPMPAYPFPDAQRRALAIWLLATYP